MGGLPMWNTIGRNTSVHLPDTWVFVDTETRSVRVDERVSLLELRLGVACYWRRERRKKKSVEEWLQYNDAAVFWDWLVNKCVGGNTLYVCGHNVVFDMLTLKAFTALAHRGYRLTRIYHRMVVTIVRFANGNKRICFVDTMNYYPSKLGELAEYVGTTKAQMPGTDDPDWAWYEYCKSDVSIVKMTIERLLATLKRGNLGSWKSTGAGLAFNIFRHRFMRHEIRPCHDRGVSKAERKAYVGGYTMPFRLVYRDKGLVYKVDVNSMYPAVMRQHKYPTTLVKRWGGMTTKALRDILLKSGAIACVDVATELPTYPCQSKGNTFYPVGEFRTVLCTRALREAIKHGQVVKVYWAFEYKQAPIFREYVTRLYERRIEARHRNDTAGERFYKMLLNSLYGKFAQRGTETIDLGECDPDLFYSERQYHVDRAVWATVLYAGGSVTMSLDAGETRNSFPAIAAHVAEDARMMLFGLMEMAGTNNVLYTDTDSLIVNQAGYDALKGLIDPEKLGYLKLQGAAGSFISLGKKDYLFNGQRVLKGFKGATQEDFFVPHTQEQFSGLAGSLAGGTGEGVFVRQVVKQHDPYIVNIKLGKDDTRIYPLELPEDKGLIGAPYHLRHDLEESVKALLAGATYA